MMVFEFWCFIANASIRLSSTIFVHCTHLSIYWAILIGFVWSYATDFRQFMKYLILLLTLARTIQLMFFCSSWSRSYNVKLHNLVMRSRNNRKNFNIMNANVGVFVDDQIVANSYNRLSFNNTRVWIKIARAKIDLCLIIAHHITSLILCHRLVFPILNHIGGATESWTLNTNHFIVSIGVFDDVFQKIFVHFCRFNLLNIHFIIITIQEYQLENRKNMKNNRYQSARLHTLY